MRQARSIAPIPSEAEAILAKETSRLLGSHNAGTEPLHLRMLDGSTEDTVRLPASAVQVLVRVLEEMGRGNAVSVIPVHAEITTQEAADILNMSRPSLIQILDEGKIAFRRVGTHRRIRLEDVMKHKRQIDADRQATLRELAAYDQELGL